MPSWNKGTMTTPDAPGNNLLMRWIRQHRDYDADWCLIWPFARGRSGYGSYGRNGKVHYVHRYMCEHAHGPSPSPKHQAAHSCGRGQHGCVNPRHVSWKTASENQLDRRQHGTTMNGKKHKLTPEQVAEIRASKGKEKVTATAARFGVTETNIRQIQSGKIWRTGTYAHGGFASEWGRAYNASRRAS